MSLARTLVRQLDRAGVAATLVRRGMTLSSDLAASVVETEVAVRITPPWRDEARADVDGVPARQLEAYAEPGPTPPAVGDRIRVGAAEHVVAGVDTLTQGDAVLAYRLHLEGSP